VSKFGRRKKENTYFGYRVPYENTSIERAIQNYLKKLNIPFRTQIPIRGKPDIMVGEKILIFADGCYFHHCSLCFPGKRGRYRDKWITKELESRGYVVLRFWEHEINHNLKKVMKTICEKIEEIYGDRYVNKK